MHPNLSQSVVASLRGEWKTDHARWDRRDLSAQRHVYVDAATAYSQARLDATAECMLVLVQVTLEGRKYLQGFQVAVRIAGREHNGTYAVSVRTLFIELLTGEGDDLNQNLKGLWLLGSEPSLQNPRR